MKQIDWETWSDTVSGINEKNPNTDNFNQSDYKSDNITITHFFYRHVLFSINIYSSSGGTYLINPIFLP